MKIPKKVIQVAIRHKISVRRLENGIFQILVPGSDPLARHSWAMNTCADGALARIRSFARMVRP